MNKHSYCYDFAPKYFHGKSRVTYRRIIGTITLFDASQMQHCCNPSLYLNSQITWQYWYYLTLVALLPHVPINMCGVFAL